MVKYRFITQDKQEAVRIMKSEDMALAIHDIYQIAYSFKYDDLSKKEEEMITKIFSKIDEVLDKHSIIIHDLID